MIVALRGIYAADRPNPAEINARNQRLRGEFDNQSLAFRVTRSFKNYVGGTVDGKAKVFAFLATTVTILGQSGWKLLPASIANAGKALGEAKETWGITEFFIEKGGNLFDQPGQNDLYYMFCAWKLADVGKACFATATWFVSMGLVQSIPRLGTGAALVFNLKYGSNCAGIVFGVAKSIEEGWKLWSVHAWNERTAQNITSLVRTVTFLALSVLSLAIQMEYVKATILVHALNLTGTGLTIFISVFEKAVTDPAARRVV
jgi:hypothetical protein